MNKKYIGYIIWTVIIGLFFISIITMVVKQGIFVTLLTIIFFPMFSKYYDKITNWLFFRDIKKRSN